jgi:hypothetical protein
VMERVKKISTFEVHLSPCLVPQFSPNFTMQKKDSLSNQNVGKCMEY